ncbi:MAG: membrane protein insertase YidC [Phycisphaerales bacterium]|nr:MAG: membrane protein insertase YidC [Phycisphaerales bacterium]
MVLGLEINGVYTDLTGIGRGLLWEQTQPGRFVATILDDQDRPAFQVTRTYRLEAGSYDIAVRTNVQNVTSQPAELVLYQFGPVELQREQASYGGDIRRVRFGYIVPAADPGRRTVLSDAFIWRQQSGDVLGKRAPEQTQWGPEDLYPEVHPIWPNTRSQNRNFDLVWAAFTDRYFGVAVHPALPPDHAGPIPNLLPGQRLDRVLLNRRTGDGAAMRLTSAPVTANPGQTADFSVAVYAGPQSSGIIRQEPRAAAAGIDAIVLYNFGGLCAACTFPILTNALFGVLVLLHNYLVFDWALAIILLVVIVRTILHPVTRWSQVRMQRFGKQMQAMAPKQKKLQEKFKDDPKRMQQEMRKLWAEEGVNPAGLLGCLPMFLQTPVWIALFATLFFAVELRHQPAFFGLFQTFGGWTFLGDLAAPDSFVKFATGITLPWKGVVDSVNVLPLLLGVVFYFHQKYLTPATPNMTPEQAQQQKIIKVMTVVMFPIFMYTAPSGLTIYFITNSVLAIFETRWIRASAEKKGLLDPEQYKQRKQAKRAGKPGGFMARLQAAAEQAQALREQQQAAKGRPGATPPGAGKSKQLRPSRPDPVDPNKRFKRRK